NLPFHSVFFLDTFVQSLVRFREQVKNNLPIFNFLPNYYCVAHQSGNAGYLPSSRLVEVRDNS
ncbi:MAG: hypothetical protein AAFO82_22660, partial [Bacteroidota bacterium]